MDVADISGKMVAMGEAFDEDSCGDDHSAGSCSICRGDVSAEFIARIEQAAAQPGRVMSIDEFGFWLRDIDTGSVPR